MSYPTCKHGWSDENVNCPKCAAENELAEAKQERDSLKAASVAFAPLIAELRAERDKLAGELEAAIVVIQTCSRRLRHGRVFENDAYFVDCELFNFMQGKSPVCYVPESERDALARELAEARKERDELNAKVSQFLRIADIAAKATDEASEMEIALSASFNEALALDMQDLSEKENETLRARISSLEADGKIVDFIENTVLGKGKSRFLKSVFIAASNDGPGIVIDVKTETPIEAPTLRAAITAAMEGKS